MYLRFECNVCFKLLGKTVIDLNYLQFFKILLVDQESNEIFEMELNFFLVSNNAFLPEENYMDIEFRTTMHNKFIYFLLRMRKKKQKPPHIH